MRIVLLYKNKNYQSPPQKICKKNLKLFLTLELKKLTLHQNIVLSKKSDVEILFPQIIVNSHSYKNK